MERNDNRVLIGLISFVVAIFIIASLYATMPAQKVKRGGTGPGGTSPASSACYVDDDVFDKNVMQMISGYKGGDFDLVDYRFLTEVVERNNISPEECGIDMKKEYLTATRYYLLRARQKKGLYFSDLIIINQEIESGALQYSDIGTSKKELDKLMSEFSSDNCNNGCGGSTDSYEHTGRGGSNNSATSGRGDGGTSSAYWRTAWLQFFRTV